MLRSLIGPISFTPGCLSCRLYQELGEHPGLMLYQLWESEEALQAHIRSENCRRLLEIVEASGESPGIVFHNISGTQGLEYIEAIRLSG